MSKTIIISERDNIAAIVENNKVVEFFIHRGDVLLGDVYLASVENILPSIDAAFVNVGSDKMGFLHASDVIGKGSLQEKLKPKQNLVVQVIKEPTGHKGPRITTSLSLPGRFLVLMPDEKGISISKKIQSPRERSRLKSIVSLLKPAGVGVIIRTEAEGQTESEIQEDIEFLLEKWNNIITTADTVLPPNLLYRDQDLLYRVIREACTEHIDEIIIDTPFGVHRATQLLQSWNINTRVTTYRGTDPILIAKGVDKEIRTALQTKVNLPSGGYLYIQTTEALTVVDVNSGKFTSSATQTETIRKTNLEAVNEIARQLRLRNIGGMIIVDFIDMDNRVDKLAILEELEVALEPDKSKPQVGQLSDLGLVELTRHRQGQSLAEIFTKKCQTCNGTGFSIEDFNFVSSTQEGEIRAKASKLKINPSQLKPKNFTNNNQQNNNANKNNQNLPAISANPSIQASLLDKSKEKEKTEANLVEIKDELEKNNKDVSKFVKIGAVSPNVVNKFLPENYEKDVFTIIEEMENQGTVEEKPVQQQKKHHNPNHNQYKHNSYNNDHRFKQQNKQNRPIQRNDNTYEQQNQPVANKPEITYEQKNLPVADKPEITYEQQNQPVANKPEITYEQKNLPVADKPETTYEQTKKPVQKRGRKPVKRTPVKPKDTEE